MTASSEVIDTLSDPDPDTELDTEVEVEPGGHRDGLGFALVLFVGGLIGLVAAGGLLIEKINVLSNPDYVPSCSINPVLSCGSVMSQPQAEVFGFPNPILGVAGFSALAMFGALLLAGAGALRPWAWAGLQLGATFGVVFVHWLIYQSLYEIRALCPYCMVVWSVMIPVFVWVTTRNLSAWGASRPGGTPGFVATLAASRAALVIVWFAVVIVLIFLKFQSYWLSLI